MSELKTEIAPGGICVAAGGTRIAVGLERPWQTQMKIDPATCPFETREQEHEAYFDLEGGWRVLPNRYTPFSWHKLIIPSHCWFPEKLRTLGGRASIATVLTIALSVVAASDDEVWLGVHIGPSAGQNLGHLHYHLLRPIARALPNSGEDVLEYCRSSSRLIFQDDACKVVAGGCRAGQCFFVPTKPQLDTDSLAGTVSGIVDLYNRKFESKQGMAPDYMLGITFRNRSFAYGVYVPVLNNWGFTEYLGLTEARPLILPWPHEETVRHLKAE